MEVVVRCRVPDRPGALAQLAGVVGAVGGDIQAVDVVEVADDASDGLALDDLVVTVDDATHLGALVDALRRAPDVDLVHVGASRGDPGHASTRLAMGLEAVLSGAMTMDHGVQTLLGGLLRADSAEIVDARAVPRSGPKTFVEALDHRFVVLRREHAFTPNELTKARAILRCVQQAALIRDAAPTSHS